ncbi:hypothetical protein ACM66B_001753 [Microbotryomycetes sp. NB124-2]
MAASFPDALVDQLSSLSGVPADDVRTQVLPYVTSTELANAQAVRLYLQSLLQPGKQSNEFIDKFETWWKVRTGRGGQQQSASVGPVAQSTPKQSDGNDKLQKQFGQGGKVYVKDRSHDDRSFTKLDGPQTNRPGSASSTPHTQSRSNSPAMKRSDASTSAKTAAPPSTSSSAAIVLDVDSRASQELLEIDRTLRQFQRGSKASKRSCFCQGRQHSLSPYVPICRSCGLVLCSLNSPISPCASCRNPSLVASTSASTHVEALHAQRERVIAREQRRVEAEHQQAQLERAAIRFPGLEDAGLVAQARTATGLAATRGYADHAGGGSGGSLQARINKAYETGVSVNGRPFGLALNGRAGTSVQRSRDDGAKVLRLDPKTKKVKIEQKVVKPVRPANVRVDQDEDDDDDGLESWTDELDDAFAPSSRGMLNGPDTVSDTFSNPSWQVSWVPRPDPSTIESELERPGESVPVATRGKGAVPGASTIPSTGKKKHR